MVMVSHICLGATNVDGMAKILEVDEKVPLFGIRTAS